MSYSINEIVQIIQARRYGSSKSNINWLLTDSRSLCFPEETLFFAIQSTRNDGHKYISDLYIRGVRNFIVSHLPDSYETQQEANFLVVPSPLESLQKLAQYHRHRFHIPVVGITGSNGKTIVKEWLTTLLRPSFQITRSPRSYNSQIGVPLSVWQMNEQTEIAIFEAGISEPGEMRRLESMISPTLGIFTHLGSAHQENFISTEEKCMEKLTLMRHCDTLIYNADYSVLSSCIARSALQADLIRWSRTNPSAPIFISSIVSNEEKTTLSYRINVCHNLICPKNQILFSNPAEAQFTIPFTDEASIENAINCLCASLILGLSPEEIATRSQALQPVAMRLEVKEGRNNCIIINDSYNSDLSSLDIALDFLYRRSEAKGMLRTLILSDLLETGENPSSLYRKVSRLIQNRGIHKVIAIGSEIKALHSPNIHYFPTTRSFLDSSLLHSIQDEIILLKGSRSFRFERISDALTLKVHETILEIDLNALVANYNWFRSKLRPETKMVCMVKASAYGAGSLEVAKTLQDHRVDYLAVAVADEGSSLRKAGITTGIIIMNPEMSALNTLFEYELEPEVYNFRLLHALIEAARAQGITDFPIHLKIDTGMHRMGFSPSEVPLLIRELSEQNALLPRSVFSHLVGSDSNEFDEFTLNQIRIFTEAAQKIQAAFPHKILRHILNSAGIERFTEYQMEMVRLGIGLYGVSAIDNRIIHNVSALRSTILQIRNVPEGDTVGYSRRGKITRPSRIADIPIGYADGLNRHLGNGHASCIVNGKKAPFVGNICMDVAMIDVTDIPCQEGDSVEIFGPHQPVTVLSDLLDTIPYEILTNVSERVKRIYFQES